MFNPQCVRPNRTVSNYTTKFCSFFSFSSTFRKPKKMAVECSTSVFAANWVINSSIPINRLLKMYYIIKLYYFVAVLSLTYTPILPTFFKNKKRWQNKKRKKSFFISMVFVSTTGWIYKTCDWLLMCDTDYISWTLSSYFSEPTNEFWLRFKVRLIAMLYFDRNNWLW